MATFLVMKTNAIQASIYDFPIYYDLIFGSDWAAEFNFLHEVMAKHVDRKTKRILEPACGTGRLLYRLAKAGYDSAGLDLNPKAIAYCNQRLSRHSLPESSWVADMSDFEVKKPYDLAFNMINSFRHLSSEKAAKSHLECMARAVRPGGVYALGFHLTPLKGTPTDEESWSARRGHLVVNTRMWPLDKDPKKRVERFNMRFDVHRPKEAFRIDDILVLRSYSHKQFASLAASVPQWQIEETYDFRYSTADAIEIDDWTEDVVYILKRTQRV